MSLGIFMGPGITLDFLWHFPYKFVGLPGEARKKQIPILSIGSLIPGCLFQWFIKNPNVTGQDFIPNRSPKQTQGAPFFHPAHWWVVFFFYGVALKSIHESGHILRCPAVQQQSPPRLLYVRDRNLNLHLPLASWEWGQPKTYFIEIGS